MIRCADSAELAAAISDLDAASEPLLLIGGGSNLVIGDAGYPGTAVVARAQRIEFGTEGGRRFVTAEAGVDWDHLVRVTVESGLGGLECLSGIPGAAGTTPVQNVGAYGAEVADLLRSVELLDRRTGDRRWVAPAELELGYRTSSLKYRDDRIVLAVSFWLNDDGLSQPIRYRELAATLGAEAGDRLPAAAVREQVLALRRGKGMVLDPADHDTWSAGSFFTNPIVAADALDEVLARIAERVSADRPVPQYPAEVGVKLSAGWLIEQAGFHRGHPGPTAPARLSTKHTLALTNRGAASTADLLALAREVRDGVHAAFGVMLHPEPVLVNCEI